MESEALNQMYSELVQCMEKLEAHLSALENLEEEDPSWGTARYHLDTALSHLYGTKEELEDALVVEHQGTHNPTSS